MDRTTLISILAQTATTKPRPVDVKGWGVVYVRALTVADVEEQAAEDDSKKDKHRLARSAARLICDAEGNRLLDPNDEKDVALLASQPWATLRAILSETDEMKDAAAGN